MIVSFYFLLLDLLSLSNIVLYLCLHTHRPTRISPKLEGSEERSLPISVLASSL